MSRRSGTGTPAMTPADERIPFPHSDSRLHCRTNPDLFAYEQGDDRPRAERDKQTEQAKAACSVCPVATACLKWALANPGLTRTGVWAATTPSDRGRLRRRLVDRLGENWVDVVAAKDRARHQRRGRPAPVRPPADWPTVREQAMARLEVELIPTRPEPYDPWLDPTRQASRRRRLLAALKNEAA